MGEFRIPLNKPALIKNLVAADMLVATPKPVAKVIGLVRINAYTKIRTSVASAGACTLELGVPGNTASLIAQVAKATLVAGKVWCDASPANPDAFPTPKVMDGGAAGVDINLVTGTTDANAGDIDVHLEYTPLEAGASVVLY